MDGKVEERLAQLGFRLPEVPVPTGTYIPASIVGNLAYSAGQVSILDGRVVHPGKVGRDVTVEQAYEAAQIACLSCLASLKWALGSLDRIEKVVKLIGFVNCVEGFDKLPQVTNGASDLLVNIWGERGKHPRSTIGVNELHFHAPVEIEIIVAFG